MADSNEAKYKNLVYLMIRRYGGGWRERFPSDMGLPADKCEKIYDAYYDEVLEEIEKEDAERVGVPSANELIDKGLKKLNDIIVTCEDPSKLTRAIEILTDLKKSGALKDEEHESIFDKIQRKYKDENEQGNA